MEEEFEPIWTPERQQQGSFEEGSFRDSGVQQAYQDGNNLHMRRGVLQEDHNKEGRLPFSWSEPAPMERRHAQRLRKL